MQNNLQILHANNHIRVAKKTFTGTSLTIQNTVNAPIERLIIDGASSQVGTPTPTAPITITNVVNPVLTITDNITTHITNLLGTLRNLPNGVKDKLVIDKTTQTAWIERYNGIFIANGSGNWYDYSDSTSNTFTFGLNHTASTPIICSHFANSVTNGVDWANATFIAFRFPKIYANVTAWKTWLASNNVTVQYQLATPTIESITYPSIATIQYLTNISKSGLASNMSADVLVMGN